MSHRLDLNLEKFGRLSYIETLVFWDRDLAMSYKDESGNLYYVYMQPNEPVETWIVLPVSRETLDRIEAQELYMKDWAELLNRDETRVYSFINPKPGKVSPILEWSKEKVYEYSGSLLS